jgi:Mn2+/Fe2+ NRAMP family transporter
VVGICNACTAGFTLLFFVLGLLISHPHTPVNMNAMFPKLSGESAYSLMALIGANIIAHNFYKHSAFVQVSLISNVSC